MSQQAEQPDHTTTQWFSGKPTVEQVLAMIYYTYGAEYKEPIQEALNRLRAENNQLNAKVKVLEAEVKQLKAKLSASIR